MMQVHLICNCGLLVSCGNSTILLDAPNDHHRNFSVMDENSFIRFQTAQGEFSALRGLAFTHTHPDHCHMVAVREFLCKHPRCEVFLPDYDTPNNGCLSFGELQVEYGYLPHMSVPEGATKHYVFFVSGGGKSIYVTADAKPEAQMHATFLHSRRVDAAFWNPYYLAVTQMRELMASLGATDNYIYHVPDDLRDESGIRRKAERLMAQYGDKLSNCKLLYQYPSGELMR